jgi:type II secretory pathway component PulF
VGRSRQRLQDPPLPALDPPRDGDLPFPVQERDRPHLAQVHPHGVVRLLERTGQGFGLGVVVLGLFILPDGVLPSLGGAILLGWYGFRTYVRSGEGKVSWDRFKLRLVVIGNLVKQIEVARFARTLGTLLQSGVPILQAIQIVRETVGNEIISRSVAEVHTGVKQGGGVSKTLKGSKVFPPLAVHMIGVGEETGRLDEMLIKVAETYEENVQISIKRFVALLEPLIILIMGAVVGFIIVSILLAIFSINEIPF